MKYNDFKGVSLSSLGFGMMRLPLKADKSIDEELTAKMVDYAIKNGVNYFDTAFSYIGGMSEIVTGKVLKKYPRESYFLATKYPGHEIASSYNPAETFARQLNKCGVDYFDFYLLHNVNEGSLPVYLDEKLGIVDYFVEQRRLGRIRHLGFSCHARVENLRKFLDHYGDQMEFCQIQLNYMDWTLQNAREKVELLNERGIPVWVMEPVRGGKLASLGEAQTQVMKAKRPDESVASWAFRWLQDIPGVMMILSGMSSFEQVVDNIRTFSSGEPLSEDEHELVLKIAESLKNSLPCTGCRYCCKGCPKGLDIPLLIKLYNEARFMGSLNLSMMMDAVPEDKLPSACIKCGACMRACPQNIDVPAAMADFTERLAKMPKWVEICRERAEASRKLQDKK